MRMALSEQIMYECLVNRARHHRIDWHVFNLGVQYPANALSQRSKFKTFSTFTASNAVIVMVTNPVTGVFSRSRAY